MWKKGTSYQQLYVVPGLKKKYPRTRISNPRTRISKRRTRIFKLSLRQGTIVIQGIPEGVRTTVDQIERLLQESGLIKVRSASRVNTWRVAE